jgi:ATP adenylyltransferase
MNRLWAPWRKAYIRPKRLKKAGCLFCRLHHQKKDSANFVLKRSQTTYAVLNLYPYNNGHVLIVPSRHAAELSDLNNDEILDCFGLLNEVTGVMKRTLKPHGFNVGINLGRAAGAGIPEHLHLHIVPRWQGDSNFMPVVGETKVISESLKSVFKAVSAELNKKKGSHKK